MKVLASGDDVQQQRWIALGIWISALVAYVAMGAPSVLSGDQAEHQFTAKIVGVPHATGYPLFTMLNAVAVRLLPFGDVARRATLMVALYSAVAVVLAFLVGTRLCKNVWGGIIAAVSLAFAPEFWSLALITEVYTLQVAFILAALWACLRWWQVEHEPHLGRARRGLRHPLSALALILGLGATHHGSFTPVLFGSILVTVAIPLLLRLRDADQRGDVARLVARSVGWLLVGITPWLYLVVQYALFRPFDYYRGVQPYHLYWGNPQTWGDVLNLALGAGFRLKVFTHGWARLPQLLPGYAHELLREFWAIGLPLGILGAMVTWRRSWRVGAWTTLLWLSGSFFGLNVAADVPKAHVYYLPAYVAWSLWVGIGAMALIAWLVQRLPSRWVQPAAASSLIAFALAVMVWRIPRYSRANEWRYRLDSTAALHAIEPNAVILCRWEQCMSLRYMQFAENTNILVQLDQTEPEAGDDWAQRVPIYAPQHPVYAYTFDNDPVILQLGARFRLEQVPNTRNLWKVLP